MGILDKLFGKKKFYATDPDFGEIESFGVNGNKIGWTVKKDFLGAPIEILVEGDENGIAPNNKKRILDLLENESKIDSESEEVLKAQYANAEMEFNSRNEHFEPKGISVRENGFELTFQQKQDPYYFFSVHYIEDKVDGVSIDG